MVKTGIDISEWLSLVAIVLPLLLVSIIIIRKTYRQEPITFLLLLGTTLFIENLLRGLTPIFPLNTTLLTAVFGLTEFVILFFLLKSGLPKGVIPRLADLFLVAFLSVVFTIYVLEGLSPEFTQPVYLGESAVLILLCVMALIQLIGNRDLFLFQSPLFWIAGGTLCYYCIILGIDLILADKWHPYREQDKTLALLVVELVRYCFYILAVCVKKRPRPGKGSTPGF